MRFHVFAIGVLVAATAHAEDITIRADITAATVYGGAAEVTRQATVAVPAGEHRILVPMPGYSSGAARYSVTLPDGRTLGPVRFDQDPGFEEGAFDSPQQAALRDEITAQEEEIAEAEADLAGIEAELSVLAVQRRYLESFASGGSGSGPGAEEIGDVVAALGTQMQGVAEAVLSLQQERGAQADLIADLEEELSQLETGLQALHPLGADSAALSFPVSVIEDTELTFRIEYLLPDMSWSMGYTANLSTVDSTLVLDRTAMVGLWSPDRWVDVALTLSGEDWGQVLNMTEVRQSPARIEEERQPGGVREDAGGILGTFSAPAMEPVVVMEDTVMSGHGLSFSAEVAAPQTLTGGEETSVPFAPISLSPEVAIEANPRRDDTAFIVARAENTSGEPLIAGDLSVYRDGAFLSEEYLETVPVGGELILPFGAVEHLQLFWRDLSRNEGETGLFTRGNTQVRVVEFGVTNVSDDPEDLRLIYAVPYSEQEDLELGLSLSVPPTEEDIDGRRGVHAWDMTVGPGETRTIRMESEMSWPEGYDLYWQP